MEQCWGFFKQIIRDPQHAKASQQIPYLIVLEALDGDGNEMEFSIRPELLRLSLDYDAKAMEIVAYLACHYNHRTGQGDCRPYRDVMTERDGDSWTYLLVVPNDDLYGIQRELASRMHPLNLGEMIDAKGEHKKLPTNTNKSFTGPPPLA
jgi:hypothetical protein